MQVNETIHEVTLNPFSALRSIRPISLPSTKKYRFAVCQVFNLTSVYSQFAILLGLITILRLQDDHITSTH